MSTHQTPMDEAEIGSASIMGFGLAYAITSIFSALLVVLKESSEWIHSLMAAITGHHWVTHGVINLIVFMVLGLALMRREEVLHMTGSRLITIIVISTVLSGLIISGYFI